MKRSLRRVVVNNNRDRSSQSYDPLTGTRKHGKLCRRMLLRTGLTKIDDTVDRKITTVEPRIRSFSDFFFVVYLLFFFSNDFERFTRNANETRVATDVTNNAINAAKDVRNTCHWARPPRRTVKVIHRSIVQQIEHNKCGSTTTALSTRDCIVFTGSFSKPCRLDTEKKNQFQKRNTQYVCTRLKIATFAESRTYLPPANRISDVGRAGEILITICDCENRI